MLQVLEKKYAEYVAGFADHSGRIPEMMELKRVHTRYVVDNASLIAYGEGFDDKEREASLASALLHDTGRYEQLRRFNTFKDSESVDHAVYSYDIIRKLKWMDALTDKKTEEAILKAVLYHNRREIPDGLDSLTLKCAQTVRDADKLDIFRVAEERITKTDWRKNTTAFWNLKIDAPPDREVVECILSSKPVDYQMIKSLSDFIMIQVGWMISGFYYSTSRRLCSERGHLAFRRKFLHELSASRAIDEICDKAEKVLNMP